MSQEKQKDKSPIIQKEPGEKKGANIAEHIINTVQQKDKTP
jgi:hypothetical protein